jgi:hypothetical protein
LEGNKWKRIGMDRAAGMDNFKDVGCEGFSWLGKGSSELLF